jgi:hypothetical protein
MNETNAKVFFADVLSFKFLAFRLSLKTCVIFTNRRFPRYKQMDGFSERILEF